MNVAVLAPHPDDESIGCGGSIVRHVEDGDQVFVIFLTSGELSLRHLAASESRAVREREASRAASILGIQDLAFLRLPDWTLGEAEDARTRVGAALEDLQPHLLYAPHPNEWHPDHRAAGELALSLADDTVHLRTYEVWTPLASHAYVCDISNAIGRKLDAISAYRSQMNAFDYRRAAEGLGLYRGALAGHCAYAEVFGTFPGQES